MVEGLWHMWMFGCRRAKEQRLFHGTEKATIPKINRKTFTRSFCGGNTTAYGKGVYFTVDASYSA
jgi:poly [ADP-ribose] polymerase 10/14/15